MKTSCINHPPNEPLIIIRQWQVELCEGNTTAAALLSYFEYWHNIKLEMQSRASRSNDIAEMHGDDRTQDESLLQFHTEEELVSGIMIAKRDTIRKALAYLSAFGFISIHSNPNPKYAFDKTRYFLFHPDLLNEWLNEKRPLSKPLQSKPKNRQRSSNNQSRQSESQLPSSEKSSAITEITPETSPEITPETTFHSQNENEKKGGAIALVEAEVISEEECFKPFRCADESNQDSTQRTESAHEERSSAPRRKKFMIADSVLEKLIADFDSGDLPLPLPREHLAALADAVIGEYIALYRGSGSIKSHSLNDYNADFLTYCAKHRLSGELRGKLDKARSMLRNKEQDPSAWGDLIEIVKSWKVSAALNGHSPELISDAYDIYENIKDL